MGWIPRPYLFSRRNFFLGIVWPHIRFLTGKNSGCPETRAIDRVLLHTGAQAVGIDIHAMQEFTELSRKLAAQAPRFVLGRSGFHLLFNKLASESGVSIMMNGLDGDSMFYYEDYVPRRIRDGGYESVLHDARRQDSVRCCMDGGHGQEGALRQPGYRGGYAICIARYRLKFVAGLTCRRCCFRRKVFGSSRFLGGLAKGSSHQDRKHM